MPLTVKTYSPSAGNSCSISMPPRVPKGSPSMCVFWEVSTGTSNTASVGAVSVPIARRLMLPAAERYAFHQRRRRGQRAGHVVESVTRVVRGQKRRGIDMQRPADRGSRSYIRCGSADGGPAPAGEFGPCCRSRSRAKPRARDAPPGFSVAPSGGGMRPARSLTMAFSQVSASFATASSLRDSRSSPPAASAVLWQSRQMR